MGFEGQVWRLEQGKTLLGEIVIEEADFPWLSGRFIADPAFATVKPWFDETLALLEAEQHEQFDAAYDRIAQALTLASPSGPVAEFLLHVQDDQAWFRWSDEPFDDT